MTRLIDDRIALFRKENPDHKIITSMEFFDDKMALVQAVIQNNGGQTIQTAFGQCDRDETEYGVMYVCSAESIAISRAVRFFYGSELSPIESALGDRVKGKLQKEKGKDAVENALNKLKK